MFNPDWYPKIQFQGQPYIFVGIRGTRTTGAIVVAEDWRNSKESFAHLFPDGRILRHGECIGQASDITWMDEPKD